MTILFDLFGAQPNGVGSKFHGGGEYSKTVFKALTECLGDNVLIVFYNPELFLDEWVLKIIEENGIEEYHIKDYADLAKIISDENIDIYFSGMPYSAIGNVIPNNVRKIGTFHGLRSIECPTDSYEYRYREGLGSLKSLVKPMFRNMFKNRAWLSYKESMDQYDDIVCVSNHTKYAIANYYSGLGKNPMVFYTPAKYVVEDTGSSQPLVKEKYVLLMGLNRWEKNGCRGILALEGLFDKKLLEEYKVVTVGQIPKKVHKLMKHEDKYVKLGYVKPQELENLYANCDFFLYPSLNEGFGMPPLEAMRYGKTCIVSGVCSLPEVCGDAVYYCNPYDIEEIQNRILMASEKKIDTDKVSKHFRTIVEKQNKDLYGLCAYILYNRIK